MARSSPLRACATNSVSSSRSSSSAGVISSEIRSCSYLSPRVASSIPPRGCKVRSRMNRPPAVPRATHPSVGTGEAFLSAGVIPSPGPTMQVSWRRMGAGVPPGLQNRWVGRSPAGGFDSRPPPPKSGGVLAQARALSHPRAAPPLPGGFDSLAQARRRPRPSLTGEDLC